MGKNRSRNQDRKQKREDKEYYTPSPKVKLFDNQKKLINGFLPNYLMSAFYGGGGKGKDFMQLYYGVRKVLDKKADKIIVVKPITTIGNDIGYLQGSEADKLRPYFKSFLENLETILGTEGSKDFINGGKIMFEAITFMRGNTYKDSVVILSEAQNCTLHELMSVVTRVSDTSQILINGDPIQVDIKNSGLKAFRYIMNRRVEEYQELELDDTHQRRSALINKIDEAYREYLQEQDKKFNRLKKNNIDDSKWTVNKTF